MATSTPAQRQSPGGEEEQALEFCSDQTYQWETEEYTKLPT